MTSATSATAEATTGTPPGLSARGLSLAYDGRTVVHDVDLDIPTGRVTVVVGANGCGKSTLLRGLGRLLPATTGEVRLGGRSITAMPTREVAEVLGLLPQQPIAPEGITVGDLVARGRHPHQRVFRRWSAADQRVVAAALTATETADLIGRRVEELSGGQRQRVWIAMLLAQDPRVMLLDEPTTFLDIAHQIDVLELLSELNRDSGTTVVMVLHDLNLAARYADHLVVMSAGRIVDEGAPAAVLTADSVRSAFGLDCRIISDPVTGTPMVVPEGRRGHGRT
ncbi:ABC transporter ATP-binding protein [Nakamurella deserti]|uniref:ABC transporter ATP-binding protein n=1 Tax=Nakamurella deserti TaxID=2164074 RepID=UPI000DBE050F|nr:ABC transporter ATP-binding protein [Nakamurella deserti]